MMQTNPVATWMANGQSMPCILDTARGRCTIGVPGYLMRSGDVLAIEGEGQFEMVSWRQDDFRRDVVRLDVRQLQIA